jgi:predicted GNAT family acetyltransferase
VLLDEGATPILYTDLSNPTSNAIYQRLGYRPVGEITRYEFG